MTSPASKRVCKACSARGPIAVGGREADEPCVGKRGPFEILACSNLATPLHKRYVTQVNLEIGNIKMNRKKLSENDVCVKIENRKKLKSESIAVVVLIVGSVAADGSQQTVQQDRESEGDDASSQPGRGVVQTSHVGGGHQSPFLSFPLSPFSVPFPRLPFLPLVSPLSLFPFCEVWERFSSPRGPGGVRPPNGIW